MGCTAWAVACRRTTCGPSSGTRKAADQGFSVAQFQLGLLYEYGHGVPQDDVQAHMWFNLAVLRNCAARSWRPNISSSRRPSPLLKRVAISSATA